MHRGFEHKKFYDLESRAWQNQKQEGQVTLAKWPCIAQLSFA